MTEDCQREINRCTDRLAELDAHRTNPGIDLSETSNLVRDNVNENFFPTQMLGDKSGDLANIQT